MKPFQIIKKTIYKWFGDNSFEHAAALAFYTLSSLAPTLIIIISLAGIFFGEEAARGNIFFQIRGTIGDEGALAIEKILQNAAFHNRDVIATVIGAILLFFGATSVFAQLKSSLNQIWCVQPAPGVSDIKFFFKTRLLAMAMIFFMGFLLMISLITSTLLSTFSAYISNYISVSETALIWLNFFISIVFLTLLFAFIFKILPDVILRWRDVWVGALFTALLFSGGKYLIALYLRSSSAANIYGAAASLVIILLWVYYSALILFLGACFTQVYLKERGLPVVPASHSVRIRREIEAPSP